MTPLAVGIKQLYVKTEPLLCRLYFFIYTEKYHVSVANSKEHLSYDYIIFSVAQPGDCKELLLFF